MFRNFENFQDIAAELKRENPYIENIIIVDNSRKVVFSTNDLQIGKKEIEIIIDAWLCGYNSATTQYSMNGVRFIILQASNNRFISTSPEKMGHIVGQKTPEGAMLFCVAPYRDRNAISTKFMPKGNRNPNDSLKNINAILSRIDELLGRYKSSI